MVIGLRLPLVDVCVVVTFVVIVSVRIMSSDCKLRMMVSYRDLFGTFESFTKCYLIIFIKNTKLSKGK